MSNTYELVILATLNKQELQPEGSEAIQLFAPGWGNKFRIAEFIVGTSAETVISLWDGGTRIFSALIPQKGLAVPMGNLLSSTTGNRLYLTSSATAKVTCTVLGSEEPGRASNESVHVNAAPTGPSIPTSGWTCVFADGFAGNQLSKQWTVKNGEGAAEDELCIYDRSCVRVNSNGLQLDVTYSEKVGKSHGTEKNYLSGVVDSVKGFQWQTGKGNTFCIEWIGALPSNLTAGENNGIDPAVWSADYPAWTQELDHMEFQGWNHEHPGELTALLVWLKMETESYHEDYNYGETTYTALHRYTTLIKSDGSLTQYIDGVEKYSTVATKSATNPLMRLILQNSLRESSALRGTITFNIRSIAVYTDTAHVGVGYINGEITPGTAVH